MKLEAYLEANDIKRTAFAVTIGVSPAYITMLCANECWPSKVVVERIQDATGGLVSANDFLGKRTPKPKRRQKTSDGASASSVEAAQ